MLKRYELKDYPNLDITIYENIEHVSILNNWQEACLQNINWVEGEIKIFGKTHKIPRLQAWYSDDGISYSYSGKVLDQNIWNKELFEIKLLVESVCKCTFNSVLANLYRNGSDSMGLHADDEKELGLRPLIASLSLGEEREITFKHKHEGTSLKIPQHHGQLLVMQGNTQKYWKHEIKKTKKIKKPRINLTFRNIITY
jgi:alkylated DNA repair dioxygenase AlkB